MATITKLDRERGEAYLIRFIHPKTKKFIRKVVWCNRKDAEKIKKNIEAEIALGIFDTKTDETIKYHWSDLEKKYLTYSNNNKSKKTVKREEDVFKAFKKYLNVDILLSEILPAKIEKYKEYRLENEVKPATVSIELRILKTVFYQGMKWELVSENPVKGIKLPKDDVIKVRFLTKDEINRLLKAIDNENNFEFKRLVLAYLHTGARRSELLPPHFTWENVDFENNQIFLKGKGKKTRYVPMNATLRDILQQIKKEGDGPFQFTPDYVTHKVGYYLGKAKIEGANCHSLRKTFGCILLQNNVADLYTVSKLLGHSSVKTTERYYVDLIAENYRKSVCGLDTLI